MEAPPFEGKATILLASDDDAWRTRVRDAVESAACVGLEASSGEEAFKRLGDVPEPPALVILDATLGDMTGLAFCRAIREQDQLHDLPLVMVSRFIDEMDRILAFECGIDDFVQEPFFPRELASRIQAVLRRRSRGRAPRPSAERTRFGPLEIDVQRARVRVEGETVALTSREFEVLRVLAQHQGRVVRRDDLVEHLHGRRDGTSLRVVDTHVKAIRAKLGVARDLIETVRGIGYRLNVDD